MSKIVVLIYDFDLLSYKNPKNSTRKEIGRKSINLVKLNTQVIVKRLTSSGS